MSKMVEESGTGKAPGATNQRCGLIVGAVYALGLDDGTCPVGLVTKLDDAGATIALYDWICQRFVGSDTWVRYDSIRRWVRAEVEKLVPGEPDSNGWWHGGEIKSLFLMDPLGAFQTQWCEQAKAPETQ